MKNSIQSIVALVMLSLLLASMTHKVHAQDAQIWKKYTGAITNPNVPILPNYSYAGYKQGSEAIPETHNLSTFNVTDYGAIANDNNSDQDAIQAAIDDAEASGGGIIFFPRGEFRVNTDASNTKSITITKSNIILKGSGSTPGGTVLNMVNHMLQPSGGNSWNTPQMIQFRGASTNTGNTNITSDASRGDFTISVQNASIFQNKKFLKLELQETTAVNGYFLEGKSPRSIWSNIINNGIEVEEFHTIASVNTANNTVTLIDPVIDNIDASDGWKANTVNLIENNGFEDIHFKGNFLENFQHHKNYIHDSAWHALSMVRAANSWVRRSKFSNVTGVVNFYEVYASNIMSIVVDGNRGHSISGVNGGSTGILQGLIWDNTNNGQWHGPDMSGRTAGSVVWRVDTEGRGWDLHSSQPRTNLIDLYKSDGESGSGGSYTNNPNHLSGLTIWNQERNGSDRLQNFWDINCGNNYCGTTIVNPIVVGYHGSANTRFFNTKFKESIGARVSPESLYEAQLEHRLGSAPAWISAAIAEYNALRSAWYGVSTTPVTGISVSSPNITIGVDQSNELTATVSPSNATNQSVSWTSSNSSIATVSSSGLVTGIAEGNVTITVTALDGSFTANSVVTVFAEVDTDGDGVPDNIDNCPMDSITDQSDFDQDGLGDFCDPDDDDDTVVDSDDVFPFDQSETADSDRDGIGDNSDNSYGTCDILPNGAMEHDVSGWFRTPGLPPLELIDRSSAFSFSGGTVSTRADAQANTAYVLTLILTVEDAYRPIVGVDFLDSSGNEIGEVVDRIQPQEGISGVLRVRTSLSFDTPAGTSSVRLWIYAGDPNVAGGFAGVGIQDADIRTANCIDDTTFNNKAPVLLNYYIGSPDGGSLRFSLGKTINLPPLAAYDPEGATLRFTASNLPGGVTIDETTGAISGLVTHSGPHEWTLSVSDGVSEVSVDGKWSANPRLFSYPEECRLFSNDYTEIGNDSWFVSGDVSLIPHPDGDNSEAGDPDIDVPQLTNGGMSKTLLVQANHSYLVVGRYQVGRGTIWKGHGADFLNAAGEETSEHFQTMTGLRDFESVTAFRTFGLYAETPSDTTAMRLWFYAPSTETIVLSQVSVFDYDCTENLR